MPDFDISSGDWLKFKLESPTLLSVDCEQMLQLRNAVKALHNVTPLVWVKVIATALPFNFEIKYIDGRVWANGIHDFSLDPRLLINTADLWYAAEFANIRSVRAAVLRLIVDHGVTSMDIRPSI